MEKTPMYQKVQIEAKKWEKATGYMVSGNMIVAVTRVIEAADPYGSSTDDQKFIEEMTIKILNAALVPDNEKPVQKTQKKWFVISMSRMPTNFTEPFRVAIEAESKKHAEDRLWKLYSNEVYTNSNHSYKSAEESFTETSDKDILFACRRHPLN
jgi:hypothetical protein